MERNGKTGEYRLTHRLFRTGSVYINQASLHSEAMPLLSKLASSCRETVHLAVLNEFEVFYLDKTESSQSIGMMSRAGNKLPAYCTGLGKLILAYLNIPHKRDNGELIPTVTETAKEISTCLGYLG